MLPMISLDSASTAKLEMERPKRRTAKSSAEWFTCSQQSILSAMDRFVKSVNNMDATVLVPSKLQDMETVGVKSSPRIPCALSKADLHSFYLMLNNVKKELLWGPGTVTSSRQTSHGYAMCSTSSSESSSVASGASTVQLKQHSRQCSEMDSIGSLGSTASSDTDSDADSMITERDSIDDHTSHLSVAFRHHLQGLHSLLHQLSESADYLSTRYQEEVDR